MGDCSWGKAVRFNLLRLSRLLVCAGLFLGAGLAQAQNGVPNSEIPWPSASNIERCGAASVTFMATGCTTGYTTKWYGDRDLRQEVGSGTTFTTPVLYEPAIYFLACVSVNDSNIRGLPINVFANVFLRAKVSIEGSGLLCSNNEGIYRGFPKGGTFSIPEGLPSGFLTIDTTTSVVTMNPGYDVPTFSFGYTVTSPLPECSGTANKTIIRQSAVLPTVNSPTIYPGQTATLTVENCVGNVEWVWSYQATTKRINVSPAVTSEYYAECNVDGDCDTRLTATVTVVPNPESIVKISGPDTVCLSRLPLTYVATPVGGKFILPKGLPSGAVTVIDNTLTFNQGLDLANTSFSYEYTQLDSGKMVPLSATKYLTFIPPVKPTITESITICKGASATLRVENCLGIVEWETRERRESISVSPANTMEFTARCITGGCDTTLTTKVIVKGIQPDLGTLSAICNEDGKSYSVTFAPTEGALISTNLGILQENRVINIPETQELKITANLNGCSSTRSINTICSQRSKCPSDFPVIVASAATCSASGANTDAAIDLGYVYADRYSIARTSIELADYNNAIQILNTKATISNLPNPTTPGGQRYVIRLFWRSDTCSRDTSVVVPYRDCTIPCTKPDAGSDYFVSTYHQKPIKLPTATIHQKWVLDQDLPSGNNNPTFVDPSTGLVGGLYISGKYTFILQDGGTGGPCSDTAYVFVGPTEVPDIVTYTDTLTLSRYILNGDLGATSGQWTTMPGNSSTLTSTGKISGMTAPGRYLFRIVRPFNPDTPYDAYNPLDTLTLTVIKLNNADDCPPAPCVPISFRKMNFTER